jgi:tRNA 2-selenouridine synthase
MQPIFKQLLISDFIKQKSRGVIFDVRTPSEYKKGHIPGSYNLPLFTDEERAMVGTTYKQTGKEQAIDLGLQLVGPKIAQLVKTAKAEANNEPVFVYCWRGGMRSNSVAWLLQTSGLKVSQLVGGYKAYRNHFFNNILNQCWDITILGGRTGSGKTEILKSLELKGQQIIDLEALANHKGSAFGALGQLTQPSTEHFENLLHEQFLTFNPLKTIWIEGESQRIGTCFIPMQLFNKMQESHYINIFVPQENRISRLVRDYALFPKSELKNATLHIKKRLGGLVTNQVLNAIDNSDFSLVANLALRYYDKAYDYGYNERKSKKTIVRFEYDNPDWIANELINTCNLTEA